MVRCASQDEVDRYWEGLCAGGQPQRCGWLKDRFGVSWQIVPVALLDMLGADDPARVGAVARAMMEMVKIEFEGLGRAWERG